MEIKQFYNIMFVNFSFFKGKFKGTICSFHELVLKIITFSKEIRSSRWPESTLYSTENLSTLSH